MAFSKTGLIIARGEFNTIGTSTGFVIHTYKSDDTLATISTLGYFPDYLGEDDQNVKIGDLMTIDGNGNFRAYKIVSVSPLEIVEEAVTDNPFDQSLNTTDDPTFNSVTITQNISNPGLTNTIWIDTDGHLNRGNVDLEDQVDGPVSSTDNAITRWDGVTGKLIQDSTVLLDDTGNISSANSISITQNAANPGGANTLWINSADGHINRGSVDLEDTGGDVTGPGSSTDNAIARFDGTTGKIIQNSLATIDDLGNIVGNSLTVDDDSKVGNATDNADKLFRVQSKQSAAIWVQADTDNTPESDLPTIYMSTDGQLTSANLTIGGVSDGLEVRSETSISFITNNTNTNNGIDSPPTLSGGTTGLVVNNGGAQFITSGGTPATLDHYESRFAINGTWTGATGPWGPNAPITFYMTRIGNMVFAESDISYSFPLTNSDQYLLSPANFIPTRFRPQQDTHIPIVAIDLTLTLTGFIKIRADGVVQVYRINQVNFTGLGGNAGWLKFCVSYTI